MAEGGVVDGGDAPCGETDREPDPSDSLRTWGAFQQALREHAGYSRAQFADLVRFSKHTVESMELGRRMPDVAFVERADEVLGNTGALRKSSQYVTRGRGDTGLAAWFRQWARLERVAVSLCTYECRLVPGLLQSEGYARAVFDNAIPPLSDEQLEDQVRARLERQKLLRERPNTVFSFIVEEYVFRRQLGGAEVMRELIGQVLELTAPRNVSLQIMPLSTESHACLDGPVQLLETPQRQRLGYSEG
ncbi:DNA-binding protein [Streptomyces viridosporus ATCC 14672]|uniref:DNA-binding protein n=1 Tax=Streptomyces viridosporus (strain ATCC 14672 / DSM 40746 / JCM 4963 / KCTC 9882 / NRRL B-12104 / FH 1290) TaxID=566461 RepID=D6A6Q0_STRV1|nr:DNA-binding protein [Streptomyces viridosporus ATCC 14672]